MSQLSARLSLVFSCIGHTFSHLFAPIFYVAALSLEGAFGLSHGETIALVVVGNVLFGVMAPVAGWFGDRWSATGMMSIYFLGCGVALVMTGFAETPFQVALYLALTGAFASIYHPVGIAWLVRNAVNRGTALGINGVFGGIGAGVAALVAGVLIDLVDWRAAFYVPGGLMLMTGIAFQYSVSRKIIVEVKTPARTDPPTSKRDMIRAFLVLMVTMLCTGFIYQATQAAMPKMFTERAAGLGADLGAMFGGAAGGVFGISLLLAVVYFFAGGMQIVAGWAADRYPLKLVYVVAFIAQVPLLAVVGLFGGGGLVVVALMMVTMNVGALPAENSLIARFAPAQWHGVAFGLKFIFAFGLSGLGAQLEGVLYDVTGGFGWLFAALTAVAVVGATILFLLPGESEGPTGEPEPVTA